MSLLRGRGAACLFLGLGGALGYSCAVAQDDLKGQRLRLSPVGWGKLGDALAYHGDTKVMVFGGIPGEEVEVEVVKDRRGKVAAQVVQVLDPSPHRIAPPCPYFGRCTGCQWQHIDYQHQMELKRGMVAQALEQVGGLGDVVVSPTIPSPAQFGYRNHARFTVGKGGTLGFVNRETRKLVDIDRCMLMSALINRTLNDLQGRCSETTQLSIRGGDTTGSYLVQPPLKTPDVSIETGQKHYEEVLAERRFRIASASFFQVNNDQAERMVAMAREELALSGEGLLVDAYAGVGTFAILLAPYVDRVIAIEDSPSAVWDAEANAAGLSNITFIQGRTEEVLGELEEQPSALILDPPRTGCRPEALQAAIRLKPHRVLYVSCDPESLARDLEHLCGGGFRVEKVQPIDMFPQTHHVECMAVLAPAAGDGAGRSAGSLRRNLVLASSSPRRTQLLSSLGLGHDVVHPAVDEEMAPEESVEAMVERLALAKVRKVSMEKPGGVLVGADSMVVLDGVPLGKPASRDEAGEMLRSLRGLTHSVITGVAVCDASQGLEWVAHCATEVMMRDYSHEEIEAYVATDAPMDKAGSYGIQNEPFRPVASVDGCYTNVVGLPLCILADLLSKAGIEFETPDDLEITRRCTACRLGSNRPSGTQRDGDG